jgi:hypothetical protein
VKAALACLVLALAAPAVAQPGAPAKKPTPPVVKKPPVFNMPTMAVDGKLRGAQLLYFLERASEELERASLETRSFIPEMVRTLDEEAL